jgi:hypothetical protein
MSQKNINFNIPEDYIKSKKEEFKIEFIKDLTKNELYMENSGEIDFLDENLFKVMLKFPKNISEGVYNVEIYLMEDGNLGGFQSIPIYVKKVGFSSNISKIAKEDPLIYGVIAVLIAVCASLFVNFLAAIFSTKKD